MSKLPMQQEDHQAYNLVGPSKKLEGMELGLKCEMQKAGTEAAHEEI
jgi:hypothetical protein